MTNKSADSKNKEEPAGPLLLNDVAKYTQRNTRPAECILKTALFQENCSPNYNNVRMAAGQVNKVARN
jgi:hypothetical protein